MTDPVQESLRELLEGAYTDTAYADVPLQSTEMQSGQLSQNLQECRLDPLVSAQLSFQELLHSQSPCEELTSLLGDIQDAAPKQPAYMAEDKTPVLTSEDKCVELNENKDNILVTPEEKPPRNTSASAWLSEEQKIRPHHGRSRSCDRPTSSHLELLQENQALKEFQFQQANIIQSLHLELEEVRKENKEVVAHRQQLLQTIDELNEQVTTLVSFICFFVFFKYACYLKVSGIFWSRRVMEVATLV